MDSKRPGSGTTIFGRPGLGPGLEDFGQDLVFVVVANSELAGIDLFWPGPGFPILYSILTLYT